MTNKVIDEPREDNGFYCCSCGRRFETLGSFFQSASKLYASLGHIPICRECLEKMYNIYVVEYKSENIAMRRLCMAFDIYYDNTAFESAKKGNPRSLVGNYLRKLNMRQYKGKTFDDTLNEGFAFGKIVWPKRKTQKELLNEQGPLYDNAAEEKPKPEEQEEVIDPKDVEMWGRGFTAEEYAELNTHYNSLKDANPDNNSNQEMFIQDLSRIKMKQMKAYRTDDMDTYQKLTNLYRDTFKQSGLNVVTTTESSDDDCWGTWIDIVEKYTPTEFYQDRALYKDYDDLDGYYERTTKRPLRNLMYGSTDRDEEYSVGDDEDADG